MVMLEISQTLGTGAAKSVLTLVLGFFDMAVNQVNPREISHRLLKFSMS